MSNDFESWWRPDAAIEFPKPYKDMLPEDWARLGWQAATATVRPPGSAIQRSDGKPVFVVVDAELDEGSQATRVVVEYIGNGDGCAIDEFPPGTQLFSSHNIAAGIEVAARWVEAQRDAYIEECGCYDPDTGTIEFPGDGEEYVGELDDIAEGIRSLSP